jgi:D-alanyl-D-alanine carboxypeptidase
MIKHFNLDNPAPYVTARSWVMTNLDTGEVLFAKQDKEKRQVASLTKIMTYYCVH